MYNVGWVWLAVPPYYEDFDPAIDSNDNDVDDSGFGEKMKESLKNNFCKLQENLGIRLSNAYNSLKNDNVGLKLQLKMLEFIDSMNQEFKCDNEKKTHRIK